MFARLAEIWSAAVDKTLDVVWDVTLPVSTRCPVCAFWRGVLAGVLSAIATMWIVS